MNKHLIRSRTQDRNLNPGAKPRKRRRQARGRKTFRPKRDQAPPARLASKDATHSLAKHPVVAADQRRTHAKRKRVLLRPKKNLPKRYRRKRKPLEVAE